MTDKPKHAGGRPTDYTLELSDRICARLANGESMRTVCLDDDMPSRETLFRWIRTNTEFHDHYAHAKQESADALTEEMLDIADEGSNDWMDAHDKDNAGYKLNGEHIQRSKLRIDTRKWIASKQKPKKYGDKQQIDIADITEEVSDDDLNDRITELMEKFK